MARIGVRASTRPPAMRRSTSSFGPATRTGAFAILRLSSERPPLTALRCRTGSRCRPSTSVWCSGPPWACLEGASSRITPDADSDLSTGCNILWIVHAPFLFGAWGCGIISLPSSGEPMRTDPLHAALQVPPVELPDEARLALRRAMQAARAGFAEMDQLLD